MNLPITHVAHFASLTLAIAALLPATPDAEADTFGSGANAFTIDFVDIGNLGNADDAGAGGGIYSSPYGGVGYNYRIGTYEISQEQVEKATASGLANVITGPWAAGLPATFVQWYEAAAFVNWMNTSTGYQAAYDLTWTGSAWTMALWSSGQAWQLDGENLYRHKDAYYFLPSEDEWYKAAYHNNDGVTANYWDYATASNSIPDGIDFAGDTAFDAVFVDGGSNPQPNGVTNVGVASPYGIFGQNGNVEEWTESAAAAPNDSSSEIRADRGGGFVHSEDFLRSSTRNANDPAGPANFVFGFRVASVPEPSSAILMMSVGLMWLLKRRRGPSLGAFHISRLGHCNKVRLLQPTSRIKSDI